ncbi:MAG: hypothetical protein J7K40_00090 [candidate division Zixibacteria bacterium]|nr:hypothetical protein [candidate division Zixibacteria bacterium]
MFRKLLIIIACLCAAFIGCSGDDVTSLETGTLSGAVTVDGEGVSGVEIVVSSYNVSGKVNFTKAEPLARIFAVGDYSFELYAGVYRADYTYSGFGQQSLRTARYPIIIAPNASAIVNVELKDPIPHSFIAINGDAAVELSWESAYGAVRYYLYRSVLPDNGFAIIAQIDTSGGTVFHTDQPQTLGTYYYKVTSVNNEGIESGYEEIKQVEFTAAIRPPTGLRAVDMVDYVQLKWDAKPRADQYRIYRSKSNEQNWNFIDSTTANSYDDIPADTAIYYYRITAVINRYGSESEPGASVSVHFDRVFDPPQGLTIIDKGSELYLNWLEYENASYYSVYRSVYPDTGFQRLNTIPDPFYSDTPIDTNTYYFYVTVTGYNGLESAPSEIVNAHFDKVLDYPSGFTAVNKGLYVELNWDEVLWANAYRIYRSVDGEVYHEIVRLISTSYNDSPIDSGLYYYRIATETSAGVVGELSLPVSVDFTNNLMAPTNVVAQNNGTSIRIYWDYVEGVEGYEIYRSLSGNSFELVGSTNGSYYDDVPNFEGSYYYKVRAFDAVGHFSPFSNTAFTYFDDSPIPPENVMAIDSIYRVYISWESVDTDGVFLVYRSSQMDGYYAPVDTTSVLMAIDWPSIAGAYYYKVKTVINYDTSGFSDFGYVSFSGILDTPYNMTAETDSNRVNLEWDEVSGAYSYEVFRKRDGDTNYQLIVEVFQGPYYSEELEFEGIYWYKVRALTQGGLRSGFSNPIQVNIEF